MTSWKSSPFVYLRWTRVHMGLLLDPRRSADGIPLKDEQLSSINFDLAGRKFDSLFFTILEDGSDLGFRYDIAADAAVTLPRRSHPRILLRYPSPRLWHRASRHSRTSSTSLQVHLLLQLAHSALLWCWPTLCVRTVASTRLPTGCGSRTTLWTGIIPGCSVRLTKRDRPATIRD